jgi:hypothetical protein
MLLFESIYSSETDKFCVDMITGGDIENISFGVFPSFCNFQSTEIYLMVRFNLNKAIRNSLNNIPGNILLVSRN